MCYCSEVTMSRPSHVRKIKVISDPYCWIVWIKNLPCLSISIKYSYHWPTLLSSLTDTNLIFVAVISTVISAITNIFQVCTPAIRAEELKRTGGTEGFVFI